MSPFLLTKELSIYLFHVISVLSVVNLIFKKQKEILDFGYWNAKYLFFLRKLSTHFCYLFIPFGDIMKCAQSIIMNHINKQYFVGR